tara:strand:- start:863 stop:1084 length:222 start_codon:yes stop_codon:yes gene_type:complete
MNEKEKRFKSLAESRTRKALKMIKLVGNLANRSHYEFHKAEADKIINALQNEVTAVKARFKSKKSREDIDFTL